MHTVAPRGAAHVERLRHIASRVVWWDPPDHVLAREDDFLCRVMALGTLEDANYIADTYGADRLRRTTGISDLVLACQASRISATAAAAVHTPTPVARVSDRVRGE